MCLAIKLIIDGQKLKKINKGEKAAKVSAGYEHGPGPPARAAGL